jgi:protein TonB
MGMTVRKDLFIAAIIAVAIHAGASLLTVHGRYIPSVQKNKINRNLEISFVSTYKKVEKIEPLVEKKEKIQPVVTPLKKKVKKVERKEKPIKPVEKITVEEKPVEPVIQEVREVETDRTTETHSVVQREQSKEIVPIEEISIREEPEPVEKVKILPADPRYSENPPPPYPPIARRRGYEGVVMLSVQVLADGTVGELKIKDTSGHSMLDRAAVKAVRRWKFKPAFRGNVPIPMWVDVPVRFVIK